MNIKIPTNLSETAAAEIQAIIDREAKDQAGAFVPKDWEKYWFVNIYERGKVSGYEWESDDIDKALFITGNCYPTEEAARAAVPTYFAKLDAQYAIARWLAEHQEWLATDEEKADRDLTKHYVYYSYPSASLDSKWWRKYEPLGITSFRKREYAEQFIAECGDHLRVVFGLPKEEGK